MPRYIINNRNVVHDADCRYAIARYILPWPRYQSAHQKPCTVCLPDGLKQATR